MGEVYESIGGTKTIRQLSETEKRLLRILAVYRQMKDTAVGDLEKTLQSSANQLRIMSDTVKDIATFAGVGVNQWLQQSKILIKLNAYLLALRELAISFAKSMGYVEPTGEDNKSESQKQTDNLLEGAEGTADAYEEANKQVDELQGKLLGFDKFQVLSSSGVGDTNSDIDRILEELQKAKKEYQGILDQSQNIALFGDAEKNIKGAYDILKEWGYEYDEQSKQWLKDGKTVKENIEDIAKSIGGLITFIGLMTKPWIVLAVAIETSYATNENFRKSINDLFALLSSTALSVLSAFTELLVGISPIITFMVEFLSYLVDFLDTVHLLKPAILLVVSALVAWKTIKISLSIMETVESCKKLLDKLPLLQNKLSAVTNSLNLAKAAAVGLAIGGFMMAVDAGQKLFSGWDNMSGLEKAIEIFKLLAGAAMVAAVAIGVFHTSWTIGVAAGVIAAGIALLMGYMASVKSQAESLGNIEAHANGGLATKGSLFYAGEAGPELVTQTSGGGSTIMNMKQLEDAVAKGFIRGAIATQGSEGQQITVNISGRSLFSIFVDEAKSNGYELVKVR